MAQPLPILLVGDDPAQTTGLARIIRDLATLLASMPEFRVATLGTGGTGSATLPWPQYHMSYGEFGELSLPAVWDEWSRETQGIVMTCWDATRCVWLAQPGTCELEVTRTWLERRRRSGEPGSFDLWGYFPFDATGPGGRLTTLVHEVLLGYHRILVPSPWAEGIVRATLGEEESKRRGVGWIPHALGRTWRAH